MIKVKIHDGDVQGKVIETKPEYKPMTELKCPFCQQELEIGGVDGILRGCPKCRNLGTEMLWQELIRTHKALDAALDKLKRIRKIYTNAPFNAPINYANVCTDMYDVATEKIIALEQKE